MISYIIWLVALIILCILCFITEDYFAGFLSLIMIFLWIVFKNDLIGEHNYMINDVKQVQIDTTYTIKNNNVDTTYTIKYLK